VVTMTLPAPLPPTIDAGPDEDSLAVARRALRTWLPKGSTVYSLTHVAGWDPADDTFYRVGRFIAVIDGELTVLDELVLAALGNLCPVVVAEPARAGVRITTSRAEKDGEMFGLVVRLLASAIYHDSRSWRHRSLFDL